MTILSFFTLNIPIRRLWTNLYHKEDHFLKIWPLLHYFLEIYLKICDFAFFKKIFFAHAKKNYALIFDALIQPHFDYGCSSWFPFFFLKKKIKIKLQKAQIKCIRFCLNWSPRSSINTPHFRKINWLPASDKVEYCIRKPFLNTGMELCRDILLEYLSILSADIAQDPRWH